jgi:hypothetical protein
MPFKPGQSGNPAGRKKGVLSKAVRNTAATEARKSGETTNLGAEARKFADLALNTLVVVCKAEIKGVTPRDRVAAANAILDRGFGKPAMQVDMVMLTKRLGEMTTQELIELNSRLTPAVECATDTPDQSPSQESVN